MNAQRVKCSTSANANPWQALETRTATNSQWVTRLIIIELSLAVVALLFLLSCGYTLSLAWGTKDKSLLGGGFVMLFLGLFGLALPMSSIAIQYTDLGNNACKNGPVKK